MREGVGRSTQFRRHWPPMYGDGADSLAGKVTVATPAGLPATDARFDYNHFGALRKSYVVASSPRCGGTHFCWRLWQTGRLGAPIEYFNPSFVCGAMSSRLGCASPADYVAALIAHRASKNGVFGLKSHFYHFEAFATDYPELLEALAPLSFMVCCSDANDNLWVAANQGDEIVEVDPTGTVVAKQGDFDGLTSDGSILGLLFPASLAFSPGEQQLYVTNLALYLPYAGAPEIAVDSGWTLHVKQYNIAVIDLRRRWH